MIYARLILLVFLLMVPVLSAPVFFQQIGVAPLEEEFACSDKITVALLDDGFDLNHPQLRQYWWQNSQDSTVNGLDEDNDGYVDNINGYDIADGDGDPALPNQRAAKFHHGTFLAGQLLQIWEEVLGDKAKNCFEILPVKIIRDDSEPVVITEPEVAFELLLKLKPDLVLTAWGMNGRRRWGIYADSLYQNGSIWIASAGNFSTNDSTYPAALSKVISVGALNADGHKMAKSNYGNWITLAAPGDTNFGLVPSKHFQTSEYVKLAGQTSSSAAVVVSIIALLRAEFPQVRQKELLRALLLSAKDQSAMVAGRNTYTRQLGWGSINYQGARELLLQSSAKGIREPGQQSRGLLMASEKFSKVSGFDTLLLQVWPFQQSSAELQRSASEDTLRIIFSGLENGEQLFEPIEFGKASLKKWFNYQRAIRVPFRSDLEIDYSGKNVLQWEYAPVDSSRLFCADINTVSKAKDTISDGSLIFSGDSLLDIPYAASVSCKWHIKAPTGQRIKLDFLQMDTQLNTDKLYLFDGKETIQRQQIGMFSGDSLPPSIVTPNNELLLWFVTDQSVQHKGWKLKYEFVSAKDFKPAIYLQR